MITNLWDETIEALEEDGKSFDDVLVICGDDFCISKENFKEIAKKTYYDSGYGSQEIACDLRLIGDKWFMTRHEYDGSEYWDFHSLEWPDEFYEIHTLRAHNYNFTWSSLDGMQSHDNRLVPGEKRFDYIQYLTGVVID